MGTSSLIVDSVSGQDSGTGTSVNIDFDPGETYNLSYDLAVEFDPLFGPPTIGDSGVYSIGTPSIGFITPDPDFDTNGQFVWTITGAEWAGSGTPGLATLEATNSNTGGGAAPLTLDVNITCFFPGTMIATPDGETAVETLAIGDLITTADGRQVAVKWVGRQTVSTIFSPAQRLLPVRFAAGSLGDALPREELTVTADHAMLVDGVLCQAGALVNGADITKPALAEMGETYTVYHIETEAHEIILANGAETETFIDNVTRRVFDNYDEFEALYGDVEEMVELSLPRAMSSRQLPVSVRSRLGLTRVA
ncbi:MAG: Hint domain-containing protein [Marinibacterium sp.]|nr:Hint domain-containing protein [Marinibacterium sp.]